MYLKTFMSYIIKVYILYISPYRQFLIVLFTDYFISPSIFLSSASHPFKKDALSFVNDDKLIKLSFINNLIEIPVTLLLGLVLICR